MIWLSGIIWGMSILYVVIDTFVLLGARRIRRRKQRREREPLPFVSILVAARNEEASIVACLRSLLHQDYPKDRYEVVIVNDRSSDRTRELIEALLPHHANLKLVNIVNEPTELTGKQNALHHGIDHCRGEFILNTDADCVAPPTWVSAMVRHFGEDVGLVMGLPLTYARGERASILTRVQALDLAFLLNGAIGVAGWELPASCIGNNFAYRRRAFDEVGGYKAMGPALTEDAALIRAIHRQTEWRISAAADPDAIVLTRPETTWRGFYRQRARWILGGRETRSAANSVVQLILIYHLLLLATPALIAFVPPLRSAAFGTVASKVVMDFMIVWQAARRVGRRDLLLAFIPFVVYITLYSSVIGITTVFSREVVWKGQTYRKR